MPQPLEWLPPFAVDGDSQVIGLSNGDFLVAWSETPPGAGSPDRIVGQLYDATGDLVRDTFQLNTLRVIDTTTGFDLAPTNDGGFAISYVDEPETEPGTVSLLWERYDAAGNATAGTLLAAKPYERGDETYRDVRLDVDLLTNASLVSYTDRVFPDSQIRLASVDADGVPGPDAAPWPGIADSAVTDVFFLSNGSFVSLGNDRKLGKRQDYEPLINIGGSAPVQLAEQGLAPRGAALSNGNFVVAWIDARGGDVRFDGDLRFAIYDVTGRTVRSPFTIETPERIDAVRVVALPDGGFVIAIERQVMPVTLIAFNDNGLITGPVRDVGVGSTALLDIAVTGDGRVLVSHIDQFFPDRVREVSIWDPRAGPIDAANYDMPRRHFVETDMVGATPTGSSVRGDDDPNILVGRGGDDTIDGGDGADTVLAAGGEDAIVVQADDVIDAGAGNDRIEVASAGAGTVIDGGEGTDVLAVAAALDLTDATLADLEVLELGGSALTPLTLTSAQLGLFQIMGAALGTSSGRIVLSEPGSATLEVRDLLNLAIVGSSGADELVLATRGLVRTNFDVAGGTGNDRLEAGAGNDTLRGEAGDDALVGNDGRDLLAGGPGADTLSGGAGDDTLLDDADGGGADLLGAGDGDDLVEGGSGVDTISGGSGEDTLAGGGAGDFVTGDGGDDVIRGFGEDAGPGAVAVDGSDFLEGGDGRDTIDGEGGDDFIDGGFDADTLTGGPGDDTILGDEADDGLGNGMDADAIDGGAGRDRIAGGVDADTISGGAGDDILAGGSDGDLVRGGRGDDEIRGFADDTVGSAADGDDRLAGGGGADTIAGEGGDDTIGGGGGGDLIAGGPGADRVSGGGGDDTIGGDRGRDVIGGGPGADRVSGGGGDDAIGGDRGRDVLIGRGGADAIGGGSGRDRIFAGAGNDTVAAGPGNDRIDVGRGRDTIVFEPGDGRDRVTTFSPDDVVDFTAFGFETLRDLVSTVDPRGGDTTLRLGDGDVLILEDVAARDLGPDNAIL